MATVLTNETFKVSNIGTSGPANFDGEYLNIPDYSQNPLNGILLEDLDNVDIPEEPIDGQVLTYDTDNNMWKAKTPTGGSGGSAPDWPIAVLKKTTAQSMGSYTQTALTFQTAPIDTHNGFNGTEYVIPQTGIYELTAVVRWEGGIGPQQLGLGIVTTVDQGVDPDIFGEGMAGQNGHMLTKIMSLTSGQVIHVTNIIYAAAKDIWTATLNVKRIK